jgi:hypothetical protein
MTIERTICTYCGLSIPLSTDGGTRRVVDHSVAEGAMTWNCPRSGGIMEG